MSWLPVPRSPLTFQVSMMRAFDFGEKYAITTSWSPFGRSLGTSPSKTLHAPWSREECMQPLAKNQCPVTR